MSDSQEARAALVWKQERLSFISTLEGAADSSSSSSISHYIYWLVLLAWNRMLLYGPVQS